MQQELLDHLCSCSISGWCWLAAFSGDAHQCDTVPVFLVCLLLAFASCSTVQSDC